MSGLLFLIITSQVPAIFPLVKHVCTYLLRYFFMPLFIKYFRLKKISCTKLITNHRRYLSSQAFYKEIVRFNHLSHIFTIYWASFIIHLKILTTVSYFNYHFWLGIKNKTTPQGRGGRAGSHIFVWTVNKLLSFSSIDEDFVQCCHFKTGLKLGSLPKHSSVLFTIQTVSLPIVWSWILIS